MHYRVLFSFTIVWASVVESLLMKPQKSCVPTASEYDKCHQMVSVGEPRKRCVPTASEHGPCHVCVCSTEGVFHCRQVYCSEDDVVSPRLNKKECEPDYLYRQGNIICSCSEAGFWLSTKCRNHFHYVRPKNTLIRSKTRTNIDCIPNSLYLIDCNICYCGSNGFIELSSCTNRRCVKGHKADNCLTGDYLRVNNELCACSDINFYIDRLCIRINDQVVQKLNENEVANFIDIGKNWRAVKDINDSDKCVPDEEYTIDCNKCACIHDFFNCTNHICLDDRDNRKAIRAGGNLREHKFFLLPELSSEDEKCIPGQKYRFKCNTCTCSSNMEPSCTTMVCLEDFVLDLKNKFYE